MTATGGRVGSRGIAGGGVDLDALAGLEEEREFLLRSLDDLERERAAGDLDEADYRTLHDDYTARAAAVLRALEEGRATLPAPRPRHRVRLALGGLAVTVVALVAGLLVADASGTRLPGDTLSGGTRASTADTLRRAEQLYARGEPLEALELYDEVLAEDPGNPAALTYKGWLLVDVGRQADRAPLVDAGQRLLEQAVAADPGYPDASFYLGLVHLRLRGDPATAVGHFRAVLALPDAPETLRAPAQMVVGDVEAGGDGIPDGPPPGPLPTTAPPAR